MNGPPELRQQSRRPYGMSDECMDALLAYAEKAADATETEKDERLKKVLKEERDQAYLSLLEERLEGEIASIDRWLDEWLEAHEVLLEQREETQDSDCPLAMATSQLPELSIPSPIGKKPHVEPPPRTVAKVERSVYRKG